MHFITSLVSALFYAPALAAPAPTAYSLITTHSGNIDVHLRAVGFTQNGEVSIDSANPMTVFFDNGKLGVTGAHGEHGAQVYFQVKEDHSLIISDDGTDGFTLEQSDLAFDGKQEFGVCVDNGNLYIQEAPSCKEFVGVGVYATENSS